jgi:heavy metal sensor kinase
MPSARLRHNLKEIVGSLRFRLTVWNTAVVLLMIVVTLVGVRIGLRYILWREADEQLKEDAREVAEIFADTKAYPAIEMVEDELDRKALTHTHRGLHMRIFDAQENLVWTSKENAPANPFSTDYIKYGMTPVTAGQYRLVHVQTSRPGASPVTIRVGTSFEPLERDIQQITNLLLAVGCVALLVSPLGGFWLAGRATRPIARIIDTTKRLHPSGLNERLPLRGTGDELDRLSATINGFLDRIGAYLQQNREFTANAAHELRSPLAAIQNSLEVALNTDRGVEEYKELLADLLDECEGLRVLVNQLLLLAENDAGGLPSGGDVVAMEKIVRRACDMFLGVAEAAGVELHLGRLDPAVVCGDAGRLRQVVNNLLDNAIKYTREGGRVDVSLILDPKSATARLSVRDSGMGIAPSDLAHIFDRFYRGDKSRQRDRPTRGSGLGLAICKSIVAAHSGRIEVRSTVDRGTEFTVILPASGHAAPAIEASQGGQTATARMAETLAQSP